MTPPRFRPLRHARMARMVLPRPPSPEPPPPVSEVEAKRRAQWMTMAEAADYLRYTGADPANSAYAWLRRHGVQLRKRGNFMLVRVGEVDDLLDTGASDLVPRARKIAGR